MPDEHDSINQRRLVAGILAGGKSRRMGRPKALIRLPSAKTMIEHVAETAALVAHEVVILGQACELPESLAHLKVLEDEAPNAGPLGGLAALLRYAHDRWALLLACDMPLLEAGVLAMMLNEMTSNSDAVVFEHRASPGNHHACCALYHARLCHIARDMLAQRELSLQDLIRRVRTKVIVVPPQHEHQLRNINSPADADWLLNS